MRRWNGWGDDSVEIRVPAGGRAFIADRIGRGTRPKDASLASVVGAVPASRVGGALPAAAFVSSDAELRVRRARGQSFPDLVALRTGRLDAVPDAVATPLDDDQVRQLLAAAAAAGAALVPFGGGTSVVGGVTVRPSARPVVTVDLGGLAGVRAVDDRSGLVTVGSGTTGPVLADALAPLALTVGHEPQSWELATVGGWVAARGSGLRSLGVGRIEQLFAGGRLEAPAGTLELPPHPASAAGPDLRQLVLGSEGRLGILTDVVLRAVPAPDRDRIAAWAVHGWEPALEAVHELARDPVGLSTIRLSTPGETKALLAFAGHSNRQRFMDLYLTMRRKHRPWSLVLIGAAGGRRAVGAAMAEAASTMRRHLGTPVPFLADTWSRSRFRAPYLRDALWRLGYGADTLETATTWANVPELLTRLETAVTSALLGRDERVVAFTHLSHVYPSGSSLYLTFLFRLAGDPDETLERWRAIKRAASEAIVAGGATISHHHGVGTDHAPYLAAEKGALGMAALAALARTFDPDGIMNPGVLLAEAGS